MATGIVNVWVYPSGPVAAAWHRVEQAHPGRLLLGIGADHVPIQLLTRNDADPLPGLTALAARLLG